MNRSTDIKQSLAVPGATAQNTYKEVVINLIYSKRKRFKLYSTRDMDDATDIAKQIAKSFELDIFKVSRENKEWIRLKDFKDLDSKVKT